MKKVLYVVGAGVVIFGVVAATFYFLNNKKKKASDKACEMSLLHQTSQYMRMLKLQPSEVCIPNMMARLPS